MSTASSAEPARAAAPPVPPPPVLRAHALTRTYGKGDTAFRALRGVDLTVARGESLAIVGRSGSGKSTLMHLLALLDRPTTGRVEVHGTDASTLSARELNRVRNSEFGFVFQQFFLTAGQTVFENVSLPLVIAGVAPKERRRRTLEALDSLGLADKAGNRATDLSGGQKQRVVVARALVGEPSVIFADEPTGNLDTATGGQVEDILFGLRRDRGITLVVVTHDHELAARCDRSVTIADGLVVADRPAEVAA
ncbi:ABC transporter ATP-binding protein [Microbacterium sp. T2.11-28]|uniref:ABC transporter ATP-binding protein n=1 Tax=unclassified Microbacterium TaxID=2609290 RepID=UPI0024775EB4|nr:ABC transporter ATP-binding protein [Microbacterium sp. T2.11-28]CAI9390095.1 ABC transporter ATP-binding protein YtrE [Microbacterium sp. T2.11-28]